MIVGISTPMTNTGLLWEKFNKHYGLPDFEVLVVKATSLQNSSTRSQMPRPSMRRSRQTQPSRSEYLCEWRDSITNFITSEVIDAAILKGKTVLAPRMALPTSPLLTCPEVFTTAIRSRSATKRPTGPASLPALADEVARHRGSRPEFSAVLKSYNNLTTVTGDRYGQAWVQDAFQRYGITLRHSQYDRSALYPIGPALTSGQAKISTCQDAIAVHCPGTPYHSRHRQGDPIILAAAPTTWRMPLPVAGFGRHDGTPSGSWYMASLNGSPSWSLL